MLKEKERLYEFGNFRVDTAQRILSRDRETLRLPPKTFDLLLALITGGNRVIGKDELMREVWADAFVEEANLTVHISALRKILGSENGDSYIETIPKRGYRFTAEVKETILENGNSEKNQNDQHSQDRILTTSTSPEFENNGLSQSVAQPQLGNESETFLEKDSVLNLAEANDEQISRNVSNAKRQNNNKIAVFALLLFLFFTVAGFALYKISTSHSSFQAMKITRVLDTGKTGEASISPDGKYLAHVIREPGKQSLQVKHITTNSAVQLVAPGAVSFSPLTFSNDGGYVYYVLRQTGAPDTLYQIPVLGGEPKRILENVAGAISFAPDGERFAFVRNISPNETALMMANLNGGEERQLAVRRKPEHFSPNSAAWSPDGKTIACSGGNANGERLSNIFIVSVENQSVQPLSNRKWRAIERLAWLTDGSAIIAPAMDVQGQEAFQIWKFPFPGGEPNRVTNDLNDYGGVSLTADSKTLVTIQFEIRRNIWLVPDLETKQAKSLTDDVKDAYRFVAWTPDKKIIYPSLSGGTRDIWIMNADGTNRKQLTATAHNDILPIATPDGRYIVFASNRDRRGTVNIWRMNTDGSNLVQLTHGKDESQPVGTPDGKWVFYTSGGNDAEPEKRTIWKVPIDGGEPAQMTTNPSFGAVVSPDGNQFVCKYKENESASWKTAVISMDGGQPIKFLDVASGSSLRWLPDGSAITFIKTQNGVSNIWSQPLNGEPPKQLTNFTAEQIHFFDWSSDNQLVCSRGVTTQEAVLISDFR